MLPSFQRPTRCTSVSEAPQRAAHTADERRMEWLLHNAVLPPMCRKMVVTQRS